jgi:hypothetical protein
MQLGESAGHAAALAVKGGTTPAKLDPDHLVRKLSASCVMVTFFNDVDVASNEPRVAAAQYFGTKGFFAGYDARLEEPLKASTQSVWERGLSALREGTLDPADLARQVHRAEGQDSPPTDRTRGAVLDSMWRALPGSPLAMTPVRSSRAAEVDGKQYDLVVIGGTPGGIACAVRAAREGLTALLVQHNGHLGGMLTNGLMQWDALYGGPRSPIFDEYARMIEDHYRETYGDHSPQFAAARYTQTHYPMSRFEPSVAERLFNRLVSAESRITTLLFHHPAAVTREGPLVKTLTLRAYGTTNDITVGGGTFVDATYEGDLAVVAKVPYRVGRESRAEFAEPHAGKVFTNIVSKQGPKEALEGRLNLHPYAHAQGGIDPTSPHTADDAIQAYNHRFCVSNEPGKIRLPEKPPGYDREAYVNYNRKGLDAGAINGKSSWNSAILPGENHAYPEATWPEREKIIARHTRFALGQDLHLPGVQDGAGAARPHLPGVQDGAGAAGSHLQLQGLPDGARGAGSHLHLPGLPHGGRAAGEDLHLEGLQDGPRGVLPRGVLQGLHDGQGDPHQAGAGLHDPPGPLHQDGGRGADGAEAGRLHGDPLRAEDRVPRGAVLRVIAGLPMLLARPHAGR